MSFATHTFSTTSSIAEVEANINNLSGQKSVYSLLGNAGGTSTITIPADVTQVVFISSTYSEATETSPVSPLAIPATNVIKITMTKSNSTSLSFICNNPYSSTILDETGAEEITVVNPNWQLVSVKSSWQDKITRAKAKIKTALTNHIKIDFRCKTPADALEMIDNLEIFNICSDYLVLGYCFEDLSKGNNNSMYAEKADRYYTLYAESMQENLKLISLDLDGNGTTDVENYDKPNRILL